MKIHCWSLAVLIVGSLFWCGCDSHKNKAESNTTDVITVIVQKVQYITTNKLLSVSGDVDGKKTLKLGFMVAGKVNYIAAEEGALIKEGQLLASLDPENYSIAKEMADASLEQTQDEYARLEKMYERKSISASDFSKITHALRVAKAQQRLQAKNLADTRLISPITGILLKKRRGDW
jgi:Membrane-fusion protein